MTSATIVATPRRLPGYAWVGLLVMLYNKYFISNWYYVGLPRGPAHPIRRLCLDVCDDWPAIFEPVPL